jgi:hypothetical protein
MTDKQTPPDWVLREAAKRCDWITETPTFLRRAFKASDAFRALCEMIERYEKPPADRKLRCAREALSEANKAHADVAWSDKTIPVLVRAIELWEKGFGK